jgi:precorrin-6B methylase 2
MQLAKGVHCLPLDMVYELVRVIQIRPLDVSWEIGCGELLLACSLSAAADGGTVVATDLSEL